MCHRPGEHGQELTVDVVRIGQGERNVEGPSLFDKEWDRECSERERSAFACSFAATARERRHVLPVPSCDIHSFSAPIGLGTVNARIDLPTAPRADATGPPFYPVTLSFRAPAVSGSPRFRFPPSVPRVHTSLSTASVSRTCATTYCRVPSARAPPVPIVDRHLTASWTTISVRIRAQAVLHTSCPMPELSLRPVPQPSRRYRVIDAV
jgi:hypothetical protein